MWLKVVVLLPLMACGLSADPSLLRNEARIEERRLPDDGYKNAKPLIVDNER